MFLSLKIFKRDQLRQTLRLERRNYLVGRALTCDIVIPDNRVSRKHCSILYDPETGNHVLFDLGSRSGTCVGGQGMRGEVVLTPNCEVSFGVGSDFTMKVFAEESQPLSESIRGGDVPGTVTTELELGSLSNYADPRSLRRRLEPTAQTAAPAHEAAVALRFYDLSVKMSLALYPNQEFQILADHLFEATGTDRVLIIRLETQAESTPDVESSRPGSSSPSIDGSHSFRYSIDYAAFRPDLPKQLRAGERFSRTMVMRAVRGNQAILFNPDTKSGTGPGTGPLPRMSICAPLVGHEEALGAVYLDIYRREAPAFTETDLQQVSMAAYFFAMYLERERALQEKRESERLSTAGLAVFGSAHHIKNILTALQGSRFVIDGIIKRGDYAKLTETWGVLTRSVDRISETVQAMLNFARDEQLEMKHTDARSLTEHIVAASSERAKRAGIDLHFEAEQRPLVITCDRQRIEEVLDNLVSNAIEALESARDLKRERRHVIVRLFASSTREAVIEVADNGPGIPRNVQGRLFDLFYTTKGSKGTGLGLAMSRKHMRQHGGNVTFRTSSEGTTFRVTLPLPKPDSEDPGTNPH